jgi:hypothetical protein
MNRVAIAIISLMAGVLLLAATGCGGPGTLEGHRTGHHYSVTVRVDDPTARPLTLDITVTPTSEAGSAAGASPGNGQAGDAMVDPVVDPVVDSVSVSTAMASMSHATPEVIARRQGPGTFVAPGVVVTMEGVWQFVIRVHGSAGDETITIPLLIDG